MPASQARDGDVHAGDLVGGFDRARQLHHLLPVEDLDAGLLQQVGAQRLQLVDGDPLVAAAAARDQLQDLRRPDLGDFLAARAGVEIIPAAGGPHLGDGLEPVGEMLAIMEVEEGDRPLGRDIAVARGVVQRPDRHVPAAGGIAQVDRVVEQQARIVALAQLRPHPRQAIGPHALHIGLGDAIEEAHAHGVAGGGDLGFGIGVFRRGAVGRHGRIFSG